MYFIQFYQTDLSGKLAEACGDRSVIIYDGRVATRSVHAFAHEEAMKRGFEAYQLRRGATFSRDVRAQSGLIRLYSE